MNCPVRMRLRSTFDRNEKPGLVRVAAAESVMGANDTVDVESALRVVRQTLDSADRIE
jgi:hypothetical protein